MKLVREHINEKFSENSDPIEDMDIGVSYIFKKENAIHGSISSYDSSEIWYGDKMHPLESFVIYTIINDCVITNAFSLNNIKQSLNKCIIRSVEYPDRKKIEKHIIQKFKKLYNIDLKKDSIDETFKEDSDPIEHINEKFVEDSDPIEDMDIGNPEKGIFPLLKKDFKPFEIDITWGKDYNMGNGHWYFNVQRLSTKLGYTDYDVQLMYSTDEAAKLEDYQGGFCMYSEDGEDELMDISHDYNDVIKALLKHIYGDEEGIKERLAKYDKEIALLQNKIKLMKNISKKINENK